MPFMCCSLSLGPGVSFPGGIKALHAEEPLLSLQPSILAFLPVHHLHELELAPWHYVYETGGVKLDGVPLSS